MLIDTFSNGDRLKKALRFGIIVFDALIDPAHTQPERTVRSAVMARSFTKKCIVLALALSVLLSAIGCIRMGESVIIEISSFTAIPVSTLEPVSASVSLSTLAPLATAAPFSVSPTPYAPPTPTPEPTPVPTKTPSDSDQPTSSATPILVTPTHAAITPAPAPIFTAFPGGIADQRVFDNCAFVGNSMFEALHAYGVVTHGAFFTTVGLNINTVYTETATHGSIPVINELNTGSYIGVLLMFGQNELGWPDINVFIQKYANLIRDVKSRQPNARVFVTGMPPITKTLSDRNENGITNENINYINSLLADLASRFGYCRYIPVPEGMYGANDALPEAASGDGLHLNMTYSRIWAEYLCQAVAAGLSS